MDPRELARSWLFLIRTLGQEEILNTFDCKYLSVVEIADHPVVLEIFKQKSQPICGVCAHTEIDHPIMNLGIDLNLMPLWLVGDRLTGAPSAILGHLVLCRSDMDHLMTSSLPFALFDSTINLGRFSLAGNEMSIELEIG